MSVAWPEKVIVSPTAQVVPAAGVSMTGAGGVFAAVITTDSSSASPAWSVTRRRTV